MGTSEQKAPALALASAEVQYIAAAQRVLEVDVPRRMQGNPYAVVDELRRIEARCVKIGKPLMALAAKMMRERWEREWGLPA